MPIPPYPLVPDPTTYANGPLLVSELRSDVTNGVSFLASRPSFSATCTGTPVITQGTLTPIVLDTETWDTWSGHSPLGSSPQSYYCQAPGWYLAEGFVPWAYTGGTQYSFGAAIGVRQSGTITSLLGEQHLSASGQNPGAFAADLVHMAGTGVPGAAGADYVQLQAITTAPGGISLQGASPNYPTLSVRWMGAGSASSLGVPANAAFPVPPAAVGTAWLNANVSDALTFLTSPPMLRYSYAPGAQVIAPGTWPSATTVTLNSKGLDNYAAYDGTTWTAPAGGVHYIYAQVGLISSSGQPGTYAAGVTISGTTTWGQAAYAAAGAGTVVTALCDRFRLVAGDTVSLAGFQASGASHAVQAATRLVIAWEGS